MDGRSSKYVMFPAPLTAIVVCGDVDSLSATPNRATTESPTNSQVLSWFQTHQGTAFTEMIDIPMSAIERALVDTASPRADVKAATAMNKRPQSIVTIAQNIEI